LTAGIAFEKIAVAPKSLIIFMKKTYLPIACLILTAFCFSTGRAQTIPTLNPLVTFGTAGTGRIEPPSVDPLLDGGGSNNQRGLSADPVTGKLVLVDTHTGGNGGSVIQGNIFVLDGTTGATISTLNTNGMGGGNYADSAAAIADDGVVYVCNQVNSSTNSPFRIYRWSSVNSIDPPTLAFSGLLSPVQRYGGSMDIRGAGATTQIIIGSQPNSTTGTNVVVFTTTDGTNFIANVLATDAGTANFQEGIAFGLGDTFWAKKIGAPLRYMSFDLGTLKATTTVSLDANVLPEGLNFGPIAVDNVSHLLAAIDVVSGITGPERVFLYDISDPTHPSALDVETFNPNNANSTAPPGFLDFNAGHLYAHVVNNGMAAFNVDNVSLAAPTFVTQPKDSTRLVSGQKLILSALAIPDADYQWQKSGTNLPNATNAFLTIPTAAVTDGGIYRVLASNSAGTNTSSEATVDVVNISDLFHFTPLWTVAPGQQPYFNSTGGNGTPNQRTIAYNALSNQLYVVSRGGSSSANFVIYVVDATNGGAPLYTLKTNNISGGAIGLVAIAAADDGSIYAASVSSAAVPWSLYRWENSGSNTVPTRVFGPAEPSGESSLYRYGDVMDVRGSGIDTEIIIDNQNTTPRYTVILRPTDASLTTFVPTRFYPENTLGAAVIGRSLQFGIGDTYWQKRKGTALVQSGFDAETPDSISFIQGTFSGFPTSLGSVDIDFNKDILAGVNFSGSTSLPDSVDLYDVSDFTAPLKLASYNFPQNEFNVNNFICQVLFGGNYVFAINGNNGIMAFRVDSGPILPPVISTQPNNLRIIAGGSGTLSVGTAETGVTYRWQKEQADITDATNSTFTITNAQLTSAGNYRVLLTSSAGTTISSNSVVSVFSAADNYTLSAGWNALDSAPYATSTGSGGSPNERTFAYSAASNELFITHKEPGTSDYTIFVVDATSGAVLRTLNTNGIVLDGTAPSGQNFVALNAIAVADDGAVYASALAPDSCSCATANGFFRLYRWADSASTTEPRQVFVGDPAGLTSSLRWGDVMSIRGAGTNTEIIFDSNQGTFGAILKPIDSTMTNFGSLPFTTAYGAPPIGRSIQFNTNNTFWTKRSGGFLRLATYNVTNQTSTVLNDYSHFPSSLGAVNLDLTRNLMAGINYSGTTNAPNTLDLYEISDFDTPMLIAKYNFPENFKANNNLIGNVLIAGDKVFALDGNNGFVTFAINAPASSMLSLNYFVEGSDIHFFWSDTTAILQGTPSLTPTVIWSDLSLVGATGSVQSADSGNQFFRLKK
jgi:hypothetical protein